MKDLLALIDEALAERGWSARQASIVAIGSPNLVSNLRRGQVPSVPRLRALCDALGLEFYVGRPRRDPRGRFDVDRLAIAIEAVKAGFPDADSRLPPHDRAQLLVAVYDVLEGPDVSGSAERVRELIAIARRFGVADAVGD